MKRAGASVGRPAVSSAGFTVAEFVAASAILFIVLMGVLGAVDYAGGATRMAAARQGAVGIATAQIEAVRNLPWDSVGTKYADGRVGSPAGDVLATQTVVTVQGTYSVGTAIWWAQDTSMTPGVPRPSYKKVRVTVSWTTPTGGSVAVETGVFGQGVTGNTADLKITMVDADTGQPIAGATATLITPSGLQMTPPPSAADGALIYSPVAISGNNATWWGAAKPRPDTATQPKLDAENSQWLVDTSGLTSPYTVTAGWTDLGFVPCQKPCTAKILVVSNDSTPVRLANATVVLQDTDPNHPGTFTTQTDANGFATFSDDANTTGYQAGLWEDNYTATASLGGVPSLAPMTFALTLGGQNFMSDYNTPSTCLVIPHPPTITVRKVLVGATSTQLNGVPWTVTLKNPGGTTLGTVSTSDNSVTFQATGAGVYSGSITGVAGFLDKNFTFSATATGQNQDCAVPMQWYLTVCVQNGSTHVGIPSASVTVTNTSNVSVASTSGANPGVSRPDGSVGFVIPGNGAYNISALYNGVRYNGAQTPALATTVPYLTWSYINITPGTLLVGVTEGSSGWSRRVAVYDASGALVTYNTVSYASPSGSVINTTFTLMPGMYTVVTIAAGVSTVPNTKPTAGTNYKVYPLTAPGVPTTGGTYTLSPILAP